MTELTATTTSVPLQRCCESHANWQLLAEHLSESFPQVTAQALGRELVAARAAVAGFALDDAEALSTAELIVRNQLLAATGQLTVTTRLDPESHARRKAAAPGRG
jgi:hypothetical protein